MLDAHIAAVSFVPIVPDGFDLGLVRTALRLRRKLEFDYCNGEGLVSRRRVWPVAITYTEQLRLIAAWCELRQDFRHFRSDRVRGCTMLDDAIPVTARKLHQDWRRSDARYAGQGGALR